VAVSGVGEVGEYPESNRKQYSPTKRSQKQATFTSIRGCFTPKQMFCDHFLCFFGFLFVQTCVCLCLYSSIVSLFYSVDKRSRAREQKERLCAFLLAEIVVFLEFYRQRFMTVFRTSTRYLPKSTVKK
jgi:hypothetical protein